MWPSTRQTSHIMLFFQSKKDTRRFFWFFSLFCSFGGTLWGVVIFSFCFLFLGLEFVFVSRWLWRHPFWEIHASAGELLHDSWADSNLHGHRPAITSRQHPFWDLTWANTVTRKMCFRFIPRRQYCLPVVAHLEPHRRFNFVLVEVRFFLLSILFCHAQKRIQTNRITKPHTHTHTHKTRV